MVEAEISYKWGRWCNSGKADLGHSVLSLDCQIKESLFPRAAGTTAHSALGACHDPGSIVETVVRSVG